MRKRVDVVLGPCLIFRTYAEQRWRRRSSRRCSCLPTRVPAAEVEWCNWHMTSTTPATSPCAMFSCSFTVHQSINQFIIWRQLKKFLYGQWT